MSFYAETGASHYARPWKPGIQTCSPSRIFGVMQHDMKRWFSRLKKDKIDVWCNDTTTLQSNIAFRSVLWAPEGQRVFGTYNGNHISRSEGQSLYQASASLLLQIHLHPVVIDFFTDLLKWRDCRHFGYIVEQVWQIFISDQMTSLLF